jgi:hypothetical protein
MELKEEEAEEEEKEEAEGHQTSIYVWGREQT